MSDAGSAVASNSIRPTLTTLFSEPLTATLRVRFGKQKIEDPASFREHMKRLLQSSLQDARKHGYSNSHTQMAVLATVGFLDESVLSLRTPASESWARRPLQEELFGGHTAGETFFQNFSRLLREDNTRELADILELHCHCILLGYKGRYAFGNSGELASLIRAAQEKIGRIRGPQPLLSDVLPTAPPAAPTRDRWTRALLITAIVAAVAVLVCFAVFTWSLHSGSNVSASRMPAAAPVATLFLEEVGIHG